MENVNDGESDERQMAETKHEKYIVHGLKKLRWGDRASREVYKRK